MAGVEAKQNVPQCQVDHAQIISISDRHTELLEIIDRKCDLALQRAATVSDRIADKICAEIKELRGALVAPATGVGKVDMKVIMPIVYTLCGVICSLIVWFTGVRPFMPGLTHVAESALSSMEKSDK